MNRRVLVLALLAAAVASAAVLAYVGFGGHDAPAAAAGSAHEAHATETPRVPVSIDARRQQLIGVRTVRAERRHAAADIRATGAVAFDEAREYEINSKVEGWVRDLRANATGLTIEKGQPLFTLFSPALLAVENELILAVRSQQHAQTSTLPETQQHAEQLIQAVRQRLQFWDVSVAEIREMERRSRAVGTVEFLSPVSGIIVEKQVVEGAHIAAGQRLFRVVDLSSVWVEADIYERDIAGVRVGQAATVTIDAYPGETFRGRVSYLYPSLAEQTRTLKVRLQLDNPRGRLRPGMYANVSLAGTAAMTLTVPADAVVDAGREQVVFVAEGNGYFTPRRVKAGRRFGEAVEIVDGLEEGTPVAAGATFFVDSESQLRAAMRNYEAAPAGAPAAGDATPALDIAFRTDPDPPRGGSNTFEAAVKDAAGQPIADADVAVVLAMPAMPSMSMPAMRSEARLLHEGNGVYRGAGSIVHGGRWDVTVTVTRGGQVLGRRQLAVVAR